MLHLVMESLSTAQRRLISHFDHYAKILPDINISDILKKNRPGLTRKEPSSKYLSDH